jgi:hypothetical protein
MMTVVRLLTAALLTAPLFAADTGFALWKSGELKQREESFLVPPGKHITYVLLKFPA